LPGVGCGLKEGKRTGQHAARSNPSHTSPQPTIPPGASPFPAAATNSTPDLPSAAMVCRVASEKVKPPRLALTILAPACSGGADLRGADAQGCSERCGCVSRQAQGVQAAPVCSAGCRGWASAWRKWACVVWCAAVKTLQPSSPAHPSPNAGAHSSALPQPKSPNPSPGPPPGWRHSSPSHTASSSRSLRSWRRRPCRRRWGGTAPCK